jgi:pimeloyl-CoA synthetase
MMTDIHQSATRALENAVEAMRKILQKEGVTQERLDTLLNAIDRDDIYQAIIARLREVAGHLRFAEERWRNQVAYHKAIRCVEAAIRRSLKVSA